MHEEKVHKEEDWEQRSCEVSEALNTEIKALTKDSLAQQMLAGCFFFSFFSPEPKRLLE